MIDPDDSGSRFLRTTSDSERDPLMLRPRRALSRLLARTSAVVSVAVLAPLAAAPPAPAAALEYVSMGDSYSAGSGITPLSDYTAVCTQSSRNAAHDIASAKGYHLTDVSCGGATTGDFTGKQFGVVAPQLNALSASTRLVTMTIGGNDNDVFIDLLAACGSAGAATFGLGSPCKTLYGDTFVNKINSSTYPNLVAALAKVRAAAPNARIAIAGYPQVMPPSGTCFSTMPIAKGDVAYVNGVEAALNSAVQRAAAADGVTFVDMYAPSAGHDACQSASVRWVEPMFGGSNYVPVHPNAAGEQGYADAYIRALGL